MKPITVILPGGGTWSMSADEGRTLAEQILRACDVVAPNAIDPTPLPSPALGMRVWVTKLDIGGDGAHKVRNYDVARLAPGATWADYTNDGDTIDLITDFRTGEVLWRRS